MSKRTILPFVVVLVLALAAPGTAGAHGRAKTVALDYTLRLDPPPPGIRVDVRDGDRTLVLAAGAARSVVVLGALGEPMLRFDRDGVWANRSSPTASADRVVAPGKGWTRVTRAHSLRWHDHRLAPPSLAHPRLVVPLVVDGRRTAVTGTFTVVPRPSLWPWLLGAALAVGVFARIRLAALPGLVAAVGLLAAGASFRAWIATIVGALLTIMVVATRRRPMFAGVAGAIAFSFALGWLGVFRHGVVLSSLPAAAARLAVGAAFVGGVAAVVLGVLKPGSEEVRAMRRDERPALEDDLRVP
jgi:hypothetical protein